MFILSKSFKLHHILILLYCRNKGNQHKNLQKCIIYLLKISQFCMYRKYQH